MHYPNDELIDNSVHVSSGGSGVDKPVITSSDSEGDISYPSFSAENINSGYDYGYESDSASNNFHSSPHQPVNEHNASFTSSSAIRTGNTPEGSLVRNVEPITVGRPVRESRVPKRLEDYVLEPKYKYGIEKVVNYSLLDKESLCFVSSLNKSVEPTCYDDACKDPNWISAMNDEMEALYRNNTWELTDLPNGIKPIGCKWIYKIKYRSNGEIEIYKARLVAKGFNQKEGIDFDETFSSVAKLVTVRCVISIAINNGWVLPQLDINNAFLYGDLDKDVYMSLPLGFFNKGDNKVCKLIKSLYGLKQAPRKWNEKPTSFLLDFGFYQSKNDYSLYTFSQKNVFVILLVYVDDIIVTGNSETAIENVKNFLKSKFRIKDLGKLKFFLGIETITNGSGVCLCQRKYTLELLHEYGMLGCKPVNTPIDLSTRISSFGEDDSDSLLADYSSYQKLIGKLIYLTITRPDISFTIQTLSQFMHAPRKSHVRLAFRVLRYLKLSPGCGISIIKSLNQVLTAHVDADWGKCLSSRRSVTCFCVFLEESLIS